MAIEISKLKREFNFNGVSLADPGPEFSPEEVQETYSVAYPDLSTAIIETETEGDTIVYKFIRNVGTKG